jgi:RES domain-containing protein
VISLRSLYEAVALEVPSAIVEVETNILLNPAHADMSKLIVHAPVAMPFDARLE